jgi:membrane-bound serine protease (ClpP class)
MMTPAQIIILLTFVGFLMLAAEVFVPGMVLGILGSFCLIGAVVYAYAEFGVVTGSLILAGVSAVTFTGFVAWMFAFPHTVVGRRIMLRGSLTTGEGEKSAPKTDLLGKTGVALTPLRPAGTARLDGLKADVVAEGSFIERGSRVVVVSQEGLRTVVRAAD